LNNIKALKYKDFKAFWSYFLVYIILIVGSFYFGILFLFFQVRFAISFWPVWPGYIE